MQKVYKINTALQGECYTKSRVKIEKSKAKTKDNHGYICRNLESSMLLRFLFQLAFSSLRFERH